MGWRTPPGTGASCAATSRAPLREEVAVRDDVGQAGLPGPMPGQRGVVRARRSTPALEKADDTTFSFDRVPVQEGDQVTLTLTLTQRQGSWTPSTRWGAHATPTRSSRTPARTSRRPATPPAQACGQLSADRAPDGPGRVAWCRSAVVSASATSRATPRLLARLRGPREATRPSKPSKGDLRNSRASSWDS
jgi:hypothetical protein